jgi:hypothetical protein
MPLRDAQQKNTDKQDAVNEAFLHRRLGISAGFWFLTWYCIQKGNEISSKIDTTNNTILDAS